MAGTLMGVACVGFASPPKRPPPHILLVLADDLGWANVGYNAPTNPLVHTPNLDALMRDGIELSRHYTHTVCAPSRAALQTGRLPTRVSMENTGMLLHNPSDPISGYAGIPRNMTGIAAKLASVGYRTHAVGKWDAGMATPQHTPEGRGYQSWIGFFQHAIQYWDKRVNYVSTGDVNECLNRFVDFFETNSTYRGGVVDPALLSNECEGSSSAHPPCYAEAIFRARSLKIIHEHDPSDPLFLFHSFGLPHTPLEVPLHWLAEVDRLSSPTVYLTREQRKYAAMVLYLDAVVGDLVDALKAKAMWEDTFFLFASDNGGPVYTPAAASNFPLKGGKFSFFEGGVRTVAFIAGGFIPHKLQGSRFDGVISIADWYPTFCDLAGVDPTDEAAAKANLSPVDGVPQWRHIYNHANARPGPLHLSAEAVLQWPHKLVLGRQSYARWSGYQYPNCTSVHTAVELGAGAVTEATKFFDRDLTMPPSALWEEDCTAGCLYDLSRDPTEHHNLAGETAYAGLLQELREALAELNSHNFDPDRGPGSRLACEAGLVNGGFYGPFVHTDGWYTPLNNPTPNPDPDLEANPHLIGEAEAALWRGAYDVIFSDDFRNGVVFSTVDFLIALLAAEPERTANVLRGMDVCIATFEGDLDAPVDLDASLIQSFFLSAFDNYEFPVRTFDALDALSDGDGRAVFRALLVQYFGV